MDNAHPRNRRRDPRSQSPIESSSDELAVISEKNETTRRRTSWNVQKNFTPQRPNANDRRYSQSGSPDELAVDAEEYWRSSGNRRSPSPINRHEHLNGGETRSQDESDNDRTSNEDGTALDAMSRRSNTPVPPVAGLPPKPERLNYREKFVLRGHLRGVSAVQFSPDCSMIASAGMLSCFIWPSRLRLTGLRCRCRCGHQGLGYIDGPTDLHLRGSPSRHLHACLES